MRRMRHAQPSLWEGFLNEEVAELWEPWMREVDAVLDDDELLAAVFEAQGERHENSARLGRHQTPAEVVLRLLVLKHVRNWSYETREREVRANLVYRNFCRIGLEKVPDAKTLVRLGQAVGPDVVRRLHEVSSSWRKPSRLSKAARCGWTRRWWRRTSTTRPTAVCWVMDLAC
jgi:transposase, IS5 family